MTYDNKSIFSVTGANEKKITIKLFTWGKLDLIVFQQTSNLLSPSNTQSVICVIHLSTNEYREPMQDLIKTLKNTSNRANGVRFITIK